MHAYFIIAVGKALNRKGVVEILGVRRVYGEGETLAEVLPALHLPASYGIRYLVRSFLDLPAEAVRQIELGEYGVHLSVIGTRLAQHITDMAARAYILPFPTVHEGCHLHSRLGSEFLGFCRVHFYVIRHQLALHQDPGLASHAVVNAHERLVRALDYLHNLTFAAFAFLLVPLSCDRHAHRIPVEGVARLGCLYEDILPLRPFLRFRDDEDESFTGHLHPTRDLREDLLPTGFAFLYFSFHTRQSYLFLG